MSLALTQVLIRALTQALTQLKSQYLVLTYDWELHTVDWLAG